jgi:hypothetical protein
MALNLDDARAGGTDTGTCESAADLLKAVVDEINTFEAKKLGELKTDLDAFVKKQDDLEKGYEKAYPALRDKWCAQQQTIETLYAAIKCAFPNQDWKEIVETCVCTRRHDVRCREQELEQRRRCGWGIRERRRERARARRDAAKARLESLAANAQKVEGALKDNDKLIGQIRDVLPQPEKAVALYLFWFKLLPAHKQLMPGDVGDDCRTFGDAESPYKLCECVYKKDCEPPLELPCKPASGDGESDDTSPVDSRHKVPWLVKPARYRNELNCAWGDLRDAKKAFADAEAEFMKAPDDLKSLEDKLKAQKDDLDAVIADCLKKQKPDDHCCKDGARGSQQTAH